MIVIRLVIAPQSAHTGNFEILFGSNPSKPRGECGASLLGRTAGACARCGHRLGVRIQSGLCGTQHVSSRPRPRRQGPAVPTDPFPELLKWAGRGHNRKLASRLASCSWVVRSSDTISGFLWGPLEPFLKKSDFWT